MTVGAKSGGHEEAKTPAKNRPHQQPAEFYKAGTHAPTCGWNTTTERDVDHAEKQGRAPATHSYTPMHNMPECVPHSLYTKIASLPNTSLYI